MAQANTDRGSVAQQASSLPGLDRLVQTGSAIRSQQSASGIVLEDYNCPICLDLLLEPVVGACGHEFCKDCYTRWLARSRAYPSCPLCRKVLAFAVPGVSRRLADLIEATFPEKIQLRRQTREREAATRATPALLQGQARQRNVDELPGYEDPPAPAPTADSPFVSPMSDGFMLFLQSHNRRPDSPYPGRGAYEGTTDNRSHASGLNLPHAFDSPASSSSPSSALSLPDEDDSLPGSPRRRSSSSPPYSPTSPYYSHMSPAHPSGFPRHSPTSSPPNPFADSPRSPPSPPSPGIARRPSWPPTSVAALLEMYRREVERTASVARQGPDDTAPASAAAATIAETDNARDQPQPQAAQSQPPQHRDISRLLQSTDQLAEQLQRASDRLTYLTEFAGQSFARHGLAPPPMATQPQVLHLPYPSGTAYPYAGYREPVPLAAYSHYGAHAPAAYPSVSLNSMPWHSPYSYGHYAAPAPGNSFGPSILPSSDSIAQSMPLPPGNSFVQTTPPASSSFAEYMAPHSGSSFAQNMPPPGTLPFTMGSEPREAPENSRRAQAVAAVARNPARYRSRVPSSRRRGGLVHVLH